MKIGVHLPNDGVLSGDDLALLRESGLNLFKGLVRLDVDNDPLDWSVLPREDDTEYIARLYADFRGGAWGAHDFATKACGRLGSIARILEPNPVLVEIHNEPNHPHEGFGPTKAGANIWKAWYNHAYKKIAEWRNKTNWSHVRLGWPGLAVSEWQHRERTWAAMNQDNITQSEWIGVHCYWQTGHGDNNPQIHDGRLGRNYMFYLEMQQRIVETLSCPTCRRPWRKAVGKKPPVYVTEVANSNCHNLSLPTLTARDQANQYVEWAQMADAEGVAGATFFIYGGTEDWAGFRLARETVLALGNLARGQRIADEIVMEGIYGSGRSDR